MFRSNRLWLMICFSMSLLIGFGVVYYKDSSANRVRAYAKSVDKPKTFTEAELNALPLQKVLNTIADRSLPAVVSLQVKAKGRARSRYMQGDEWLQRFFGEEVPSMPQQGFGSGFVISKDGYLISNYHVVEGAIEIIVVFEDKNGNEKEYEAKIVGTDKYSDVALLKIDGVNDLPYLVMGDSDKTRIGDMIVAIGKSIWIIADVYDGSHISKRTYRAWE